MSLTLSTSSLRSLLALTEKRDELLAEIQKIETKISDALQGGSSARITTGHKTGNGRKAGRPAKTAKHGNRGALKELILAGLREAGEAGIAVRHLAAKLGLKPQNIHVWLHTTGKKTGLIKALGNGVYRLEEALGVKPAEKLTAPKPQVTAKSGMKAPSQATTKKATKPQKKRTARNAK